jgi:hypothetical protein
MTLLLLVRSLSPPKPAGLDPPKLDAEVKKKKKPNFFSDIFPLFLVNFWLFKQYKNPKDSIKLKSFLVLVWNRNTVRDFGFLNTRTPTAGLYLQFDTATSGWWRVIQKIYWEISTDLFWNSECFQDFRPNSFILGSLVVDFVILDIKQVYSKV